MVVTGKVCGKTRWRKLSSTFSDQRANQRAKAEQARRKLTETEAVTGGWQAAMPAAERTARSERVPSEVLATQ